ncbi:BON domain-containing protein [Sorangium sp. So ce1036]|uniref:BON domain-containing protein n=1 Tax=Sorangium sp. So ce1036 TaxID=3133328 RepID=UPI003F112F89
MDDGKMVRALVRAALGRALRCDPDRLPIGLKEEGGVLTLQGEVPDIAAKRRALKEAAAVAEVRRVADQLHVKPAVRMGDGAIRDHLRDALIAECAFQECAVRVRDRGTLESVRTPIGTVRGTIDVSVDDGVVTLDGSVPSLVHKRLAGALAWWIPGSRDVANALEIAPPEEDNDDQITEAIRAAHERDPLVDAVAIGVRTQSSVATLYGTATSEEQKAAAERDAWCTLGVDDVVSQIQVVPPTAPTRETRTA